MKQMKQGEIARRTLTDCGYKDNGQYAISAFARSVNIDSIRDLVKSLRDSSFTVAVEYSTSQNVLRPRNLAATSAVFENCGIFNLQKSSVFITILFRQK